MPCSPGAKPIVLRGYDFVVDAVAISPDNRWVVTGSDDKTSPLWLVQINDLINLARVTGRRNFSADEWQLYFPGQPRVPTSEGVSAQWLSGQTLDGSVRARKIGWKIIESQAPNLAANSSP